MASAEGPGACFSKLPVIFGPVKLFLIAIKDGSFANGAVKLLAKETKWTSSELRAHPTFLGTLISKYDFGPVKLPGLSRNRPLDTQCWSEFTTRRVPIARFRDVYLIFLIPKSFIVHIILAYINGTNFISEHKHAPSSAGNRSLLIS